MKRLVYLDGELVPEENARISVFDHGLLYGDGVFEGLRCYNSRVFRLDEHLRRLYTSAKAIMLKIPVAFDEMRKAVIETIRANKLHDSYVRIVVTRGVGDLGLDPAKCPRPGVIIIAGEIQLYPESVYEKGLSLMTVPTRRNSREAVNPAIKSLNYLNNILAKIEATSWGAMEGLILNNEGYVTECTGENIFAIKDRVLLTPPVSSGALPGITRDAIISIAGELGYETRQVNMTRYDLYSADECFVTGSAAETMAIMSVDKRVIGEGTEGPITKEIRKAFRELTKREGVPVFEKN